MTLKELEELLSQGRAELEHGNLVNAVDFFRKASKLSPVDERGWYYLGLAHFIGREFDEAVRVLRQAIECNPDFEPSWLCLGKTFFEKGSHTEAIDCFSRAIDLDSSHEPCWFWLARSYHEIKDYDQAIKAYEKAVTLKPGDFSLWLWLGRAYSESKDYDQAIKAYRKATSLNPSHEIALRELAAVYSLRGSYSQAKRILRKFEKMVSDDWIELRHHVRQDEELQETILKWMRSAEMSLREGRLRHAAMDAWTVIEMLLRIAYEYIFDRQKPPRITYKEVIQQLKSKFPGKGETAKVLHQARRLRNKIHPTPGSLSLSREDVELIMRVAQQLCYWLDMPLD